MTVSRHNALTRLCRSKLAACGLGLMLAAPGAVWAQQADGPPQPLQLTPLVPEAALQQAVAAQEADGEGTDEAEADAGAAGGDLLPSTVRAAGLEAADIAGIGILTAEAGGLPATLWQGTDMETALAALAALPVQARSPTVQALTRRLLVTAAPPPEGGADGWDYIGLRADKLAAIGLLDDLLALADLLPLAEAPGPLQQRAAEAYVMAGDWSAACAIARRGVDSDQSGYWLRIVAACRLMDGNRPGAELALDILADTGAPEPFYRALMARLMDFSGSGGQAPLLWPEAEKLTPLTLGLALRTGIVPPAAVMAAADPLAQTALAGAPALAPLTRLPLAEQAAARGALTPQRLRALLAALDSPADAGGGLPGPMARAALLQAAAAADDPAGRLNALSVYWAAARDAGLDAVAAAVSAPLAVAVAPAPDLVAWAPDAVRMLALAGQPQAVTDWYQMVRAHAQAGDTPMADRLLDIWALAVVVDDAQAVPFSDRILDLWYQTRSGRADTGRGDRALLFFSVLEGLGYVVPPMVWEQLGALGVDILAPSPAGAEWNALVTAASGGMIGETIAHALALLGPDGVLGAPPEALRSVLESLRAVGLDREARMLAAEALQLRGF